MHADADILVASWLQQPGCADLDRQRIVVSFRAACEAHHHVHLRKDESRVDALGRYWAFLLDCNERSGVLAAHATLDGPDIYTQRDPHALEVLRTFHQEGTKICVLTNNEGEALRELQEHSLDGFVDHIVESSAVGIEKPAQAIFQRAAQMVGLPTKSGWFVGDGVINDLLGAALAGFGRPLLFDPFGAAPSLPHEYRIQSLRELL
ncbi:MAG: HAD family hydrolase [Paenarthrobacter ureafaciens]|nr:HAD family hydrolase [Paenarthrobacter ureafaciens]